MSTEQVTAAQVTMEQAIKLLTELCASNKSQVSNLTELCASNKSQVSNLESRFEEINEKFARTTTALEQLMKKLGNSEEGRNGEEVRQSNAQTIDDQDDDDSLLRSHLVDNDLHQSNYSKNIKTTTMPLSSHAIIIPPSSSIPTFSGKHSERPKQFLVRIQEYAETVHGWDRSTLLSGISQFLRDTALDWYCQVKVSGRQPQIWAEFVELFLTQFNSPIRSARQEQEWYECKQKEDETINEFVIRLRALWTEQKPKETEVDLVRHLFCKMRNDLLSMIVVPRGATLDEIILEAQKVEEVLYRRKKDERRLKYLNQNSSRNDNFNISKSSNDMLNKQRQPYLTMNVNYPSQNGRTTTEINNTQQSQSMRCYNCGKWDHATRNCRTNNSTIYQGNEGQRYSKNDGRAWDRRDTNARL